MTDRQPANRQTLEAIREATSLMNSGLYASALVFLDQLYEDTGDTLVRLKRLQCYLPLRLLQDFDRESAELKKTFGNDAVSSVAFTGLVTYCRSATRRRGPRMEKVR